MHRDPNPNHYQSLIRYAGRHITCARVFGRGPRHCSGNAPKVFPKRFCWKLESVLGTRPFRTPMQRQFKKRYQGPFQQIFQIRLDHRLSAAASSCVSSSACPGSRLLLQRLPEMQPPSLHKTTYVGFPLLRHGTAKPNFANDQGTPKMGDPGNSTF